MDDSQATAQNTPQQPVFQDDTASSQQLAQQGAAAPASQPATQSWQDILQPTPPVSVPGHAKEQAPIASMDVPVQTVEAPTHEYVHPSEKTPELHQEVREAGVEHTKETAELTLEDKNAGLEYAKESVPVPTQPVGMVQLPHTKEEAQQKINAAGSATNASYGLAVLLEKVWKKLQFVHQTMTG